MEEESVKTGNLVKHVCKCRNVEIHKESAQLIANYKNSTPTVKNIKIHFEASSAQTLQLQKVLEEKVKLGSPTTKKSHNFYIYKDTYVYVIFPRRGYINCTKLPNYADIEKAISNFYSKLDINNNIYIHEIDNIQASGRMIWATVNLATFKTYVNCQSSARANYNPSHFPGLNIKVPNKGTIVIFSSCKYTIVGVKEKSDIIIVFRAAFLLLYLFKSGIIFSDPRNTDCYKLNDILKEHRKIFS